MNINRNPRNLLSETEPCVSLLLDRRNEEVDTCLAILRKTTVENSSGVKSFKSSLSVAERCWCWTFRKLFAAAVACSGGFHTFSSRLWLGQV